MPERPEIQENEKGKCSSLSLLLLILAAAANAQVASSTLQGEVRDGTGAMIPGARLTVPRISTGSSRERTTNPHGAYRIDELQPGVYIPFG